MRGTPHSRTRNARVSLNSLILEIIGFISLIYFWRHRLAVLFSIDDYTMKGNEEFINVINNHPFMVHLVRAFAPTTSLVSVTYLAEIHNCRTEEDHIGLFAKLMCGNILFLLARFMTRSIEGAQFTASFIQDFKTILLLTLVFCIFYFVWRVQEDRKLKFALSNGAAIIDKTSYPIFLTSGSGAPLSLVCILIYSAEVSIMVYIARYAYAYSFCFLLKRLGTLSS